jgi:DNA-binding transcriptional regulator YhcF (GntR family)
LADRLGVSRGPVREAFRVLEEAGLLQLEKNRGVFVRQIPIEEALEIFELRAMMEAHVGASLAQNASPAQIAELEELVEQMQAAVAADQEARYYELNLAFHERMVGFAGNHKLLALYRKLIRELSLFRLRNLADQGHLLTSIAEHRDMLRASSNDAELCQLEHTGFGVSHDALGAALCESWGLGPAVVASVRHHVMAQGLLELPGPPARRPVLMLSAVAAAMLGGQPEAVDEVVHRLAPQADLDAMPLLRTARRLADEMAEALAHGRAPG